MKASHAGILMLLIVGLAGSSAGLAGNEGAENNKLLHGTWKVLQCLKFDTADQCKEDSDHLLVDDMVRVMPLFGNTGIVSVASIETDQIFLFSGYNLITGMQGFELEVTEGSTREVSLPYLSIEFWDEGRGSSSPKEKRLELHLIKGSGASGQPACRAALKKLSKDRLSDNLGNGKTVCAPDKGPRVFWSLCTIDRASDSCKRVERHGDGHMLIPPDDGMGTGGGGDSGVPIDDDEGAA